MSYRLMIAAVAALAVFASGCSSNKPSSTASSSASSPTASASDSTSAPAGATLDVSACLEVTQANLNLATVNTKDAARAPADTLEKYNPPADVREAIEHFVGSGGMQFKDPDFDKYNKRIDDWIKQVCPL